MYKDKTTLIESYLNSIQAGVTTINTLLKPEHDDISCESFLVASKSLFTSIDISMIKLHDIYTKYQNEIITSGTSLVELINKESKLIMDNVKIVNDELNSYKKDKESTSSAIGKYMSNKHKEPRLCFNSDVQHTYQFDLELMNKYPGSYFMELYKDPEMWMDNGDINIQHNDDNYEYIHKYMNDDVSLLKDLKKMNDEQRNNFVSDLDYFKLPVKLLYMKNTLVNEEDSLSIQAWKNRFIMFNNNCSKNINNWLKSKHTFSTLFNSFNIDDIKYDRKNNQLFVEMELNYFDFIDNYCETGILQTSLIQNRDSVDNYFKLEDDFEELDIKLKETDKTLLKKYFDTRLLGGSCILLTNQYDSVLSKWLKGKKYWQLVYRASEAGFSASTFHKHCDYLGPTIILIKSSEGYIFGGYTSVSWTSENIFKDDPEAFIFTLINPCNLNPTKFDKRKESKYAIKCDSNAGPVFGNEDWCDMFISDQCFSSNTSYISNNGKYGYSCSQYGKALFVKTDKKDSQNWFIVSDYEVYCDQDEIM